MMEPFVADPEGYAIVIPFDACQCAFTASRACSSSIGMDIAGSSCCLVPVFISLVR